MRTSSLPLEHLRPGLAAVMPMPDACLSAMGPYASIKRFTLTDHVFPPHPHAGFTALTYVLRSSPGKMLNRDSLGLVGTIAPGGAHWTIANAGIMHEEKPEIDGVPVEGFQIFINHPAAAKWGPPRRAHLEADELAVWEEAPGVSVRLVMGRWGEHVVDPGLPVTPMMADIALSPGASLVWPLSDGEDAMLYVESGSIRICAENDTAQLNAHQVAAFKPGATSLVIEADAANATLFAFSGPRLGEPVVAGGPFIMTTQTDIERAFELFRSGAMGHLAPRGL